MQFPTAWVLQAELHRSSGAIRMTRRDGIQLVPTLRKPRRGASAFEMHLTGRIL